MEGAQTGMRAFRGYGPQEVTRKIEEWHWEATATEGESSVFEIRRGSGIQYYETRGTLQEIGDHP